MLTISYQTAFKKDFKKIKKRGYDISKLERVIDLLAEEKSLPEVYKDHELSGNWRGYRECHIEPDWLLIYECVDDVLVLMLYRLGSHAMIFKK